MCRDLDKSLYKLDEALMLNHECNKQEIFGKFRDFEKKGKFSFVFFCCSVFLENCTVYGPLWSVKLFSCLMFSFVST